MEGDEREEGMRRKGELTIRHGNTVLQARRSFRSDALLSLVQIRLDHDSHDLGSSGSGGELSGLETHEERSDQPSSE